jgi:type IV secretion system protein VirD4
MTIPPSELVRLRGLIRIVLNQLSARLTDRLDHQAEQPRRQLLLLLDEFTALGRIDFLHRAIAYLRGFDIRVFISIQSLSQLFEVYGQHQSITTNCAVQVSYGANDIETARLLSEMTGRFTVNLERASQSGGVFGGGRVTFSQADAARPLLTPDEVRRLPKDESIVFVSGMPPIRARRVPYFTDPVFTRRAELAPPPASDRLDHDWKIWTDWRAVPPHPSALEEASGAAGPQPDDLDDILRDGSA